MCIYININSKWSDSQKDDYTDIHSFLEFLVTRQARVAFDTVYLTSLKWKCEVKCVRNSTTWYKMITITYSCIILPLLLWPHVQLILRSALKQNSINYLNVCSCINSRSDLKKEPHLNLFSYFWGLKRLSRINLALKTCHCTHLKKKEREMFLRCTSERRHRGLISQFIVHVISLLNYKHR